MVVVPSNHHTKNFYNVIEMYTPTVHSQNIKIILPVMRCRFGLSKNWCG